MPWRALSGGWRGVSKLAGEADVSVAELAGVGTAAGSTCLNSSHPTMQEGQEVNSQVKQADKAQGSPKPEPPPSLSFILEVKSEPWRDSCLPGAYILGVGGRGGSRQEISK